jgi:hypothetical protein
MAALGQESKSTWTSERAQSGITEISARSEIAAPQGAGFATLKIKHQPGITPPVIVYLIVESPNRIPLFPFGKYDGPVDRTQEEFIEFELAPGDQGRTRTVKAMPDGYYSVTPADAFVFDTIEKGVVSFLLAAKDGQKLNVMVNGLPSSIKVSFNTTGLQKLLEQAGLKAVPRKNPVQLKK